MFAPRHFALLTLVAALPTLADIDLSRTGKQDEAFHATRRRVLSLLAEKWSSAKNGPQERAERLRTENECVVALKVMFAQESRLTEFLNDAYPAMRPAASRDVAELLEPRRFKVKATESFLNQLEEVSGPESLLVSIPKTPELQGFISTHRPLVETEESSEAAVATYVCRANPHVLFEVRGKIYEGVRTEEGGPTAYLIGRIRALREIAARADRPNDRKLFSDVALASERVLELRQRVVALTPDAVDLTNELDVRRLKRAALEAETEPGLFMQNRERVMGRTPQN